jgi:hypothetical protein
MDRINRIKAKAMGHNGFLLDGFEPLLDRERGIALDLLAPVYPVYPVNLSSGSSPLNCFTPRNPHRIGASEVV